MIDLKPGMRVRFTADYGRSLAAVGLSYPFVVEGEVVEALTNIVAVVVPSYRGSLEIAWYPREMVEAGEEEVNKDNEDGK